MAVDLFSTDELLLRKDFQYEASVLNNGHKCFLFIYNCIFKSGLWCVLQE